MATNREKTSPVSSFESSKAQRIRALKTQRLLHAEHLLTRRIEYARKVGLTFEGKRDVSNALGYQKRLRPGDFRARFKRGDIAKAIIKKLPCSTYRDGFTVVEKVASGDDSAGNSKFNNEVAELITRLNLPYVMQEAEILQRQGRYSVIYIVAPGEDINVELTSDMVGGIDNITRLIPFHEEEASVTATEKDWTNARCGLPTEYQLTTESGTKKCHWSRVIHIADSLTAYGDPVLEHIWDRLDDRLKVIGAGSEMWWVNAVRKVLFDMDPEISLQPEDETDLDDDLDKMWHGQDPYAMTRGMTPKSLDVNLHSFADDQEAIERTIAAAEDYPHAVLFGNKTGRLAGIEDSEDYRRTVKAHGKNFSGPKISLFIDWCQRLSLLDDVTYEVRWPKTEIHNLKDKADISFAMAKANERHHKVTGEVLLTGDEIREDVFDKPSLGDDAVVVPVDASTSTISAASVEVDLVSRVVDEYSSNVQLAVTDAIDVAVTAHVADTTIDIAAAFESSMLELLPPMLLDAANAGGEYRAVLTNSVGILKVGSADLSSMALRRGEIIFNPSTTHLQTLATTRAGILITDLTGDMRLGAERVLARGVELGWGQAQIVSHLRGSIGLQLRQVDYVFDMMGRMGAATPGSVVTYGSTSVVIPPGGVTQVFLDGHVNSYIDTLLTQRLELIARSELARAANEGQHEYWRQAQLNGDLPDNVFRQYIKNTDRHILRHGELARIGTPFTVEPGADPNCGCSQGLVVV